MRRDGITRSRQRDCAANGHHQYTDGGDDCEWCGHQRQVFTLVEKVKFFEEDADFILFTRHPIKLINLPYVEPRDEFNIWEMLSPIDSPSLYQTLIIDDEDTCERSFEVDHIDDALSALDPSARIVFMPPCDCYEQGLQGICCDPVHQD